MINLAMCKDHPTTFLVDGFCNGCRLERHLEDLAGAAAAQGPAESGTPATHAELERVLRLAVLQASVGKGRERHAGVDEAFEDQQIVQLGVWMGNAGFEVGQACKKAIESFRMPKDRAIGELLGAINYLAAAVLVREELP